MGKVYHGPQDNSRIVAVGIAACHHQVIFCSTAGFWHPFCLHPSLSSAARLSATKPPSFTKSCSIWMLLLPHWFTFHSVFNNFMQKSVMSQNIDRVARCPVFYQTVRFEPDCLVLGWLVPLKISARTRQIYRYIHIYTDPDPQFLALAWSLEIGRVSCFFNVQTWQPYPSMFPVPNSFVFTCFRLLSWELPY